MEDLPPNPQGKSSASHALEDLLGLLADLDVVSLDHQPKSEARPPVTQQEVDSSISSSISKNGKDITNNNSSLIAAHRQSLLLSLAEPIPAPPPHSHNSPTTAQNSSSASIIIAAGETDQEKNLDNNLDNNLDANQDGNHNTSLENNSKLSLEASITTNLIHNLPISPEYSPPVEGHPKENTNSNSSAELTINNSTNAPINTNQSLSTTKPTPNKLAINNQSIHDSSPSENIQYNLQIENQVNSQANNKTNSRAGGAVSSGLGFLMDLVFRSSPPTPPASLPPVSQTVDSKNTKIGSNSSLNIPQVSYLELPEVTETPRNNLEINQAKANPPEILEIESKSSNSSEDFSNNYLLEEPLEIIPPRTFKPEVIEPEVLEPEYEDPLDILQRLLVNPDVYDAQKLLQSLEISLRKLENQIYEPEKLIELLLPTIAELLSMKISQSKEEVVDAITPIIDEVIQHRIEQDRVAMSGAIAPIISEAISKQIADSPEEIANAIGPTMGKAIQEQIRLEKDSMVDALYPIIGSTISKYMGEAIADINRQVETTLSVKGVKRKIQSKLQGVSEAELILREALPFNVFAAFLIHKSSGLLIADAQAPQQQNIEADMIAGMLTAIRSFANDCMTNGGSSAELNQIEYSDSKIILEVAGYCYLAIVVRGQVSQDFIKKFRRAMVTIVKIYNKLIMNFDGDRSTIPEEINILIENLLLVESKPTGSRYPIALSLVIFIVVSIVAIPWGIYQYRQSNNNRLTQQVATALDQTPEISVYRLEPEITGDTLRLKGKVPNNTLKEKAETIAKQVVPQKILDNQIISVIVPVDSSFITTEVKRMTLIINQIPGNLITTKYKDGEVTITGITKDQESINKITAILKAVPGIKLILNQVQLGNINQNSISRRIYFEAGSATFPADTLPQIIEVKNLLDFSPNFRLRITGHTDATGELAENQRLATARAASVQQILLNQGVDQSRLEIRGSNNALPEAAELWQSRFVEFELIAPNIQN